MERHACAPYKQQAQQEIIVVDVLVGAAAFKTLDNGANTAAIGRRHTIANTD